MKPLKKFFMKRWPQSDKKEAPKKLATSGVCSKQHRSDTAQTMDDTCSMEESGGEQEAAPWRVEKILVNGPFRDEDWWENESSDGGFELEHEDSEASKDSNNKQTQPDAATGKRFRNCGLETFRQTQQAWRVRDPQVTILSRSPSANIKRDLVKALAGCRQFELPPRLPLKDMIAAYTEVWNGESE